jgi:hypothetical protein
MTYAHQVQVMVGVLYLNKPQVTRPATVPALFAALLLFQVGVMDRFGTWWDRVFWDAIRWLDEPVFREGISYEQTPIYSST